MVERAEHLAEVEPQQVQNGHLRAVGLRGRNGDLGAGPCVEYSVGLARDARADDVDDGENVCTALFRLTHGGHRVERLAGLADDDHEVALADDGVAVAEFGGEAHLDAAAQHPLEVILADDTDVVRRAAGDDIDLADIADLLVSHVQVAQHDAAVLNAGGGRPADGMGLLVDLFEHEVRVAALFRSVDVPVDVVSLLLHGVHLAVIDADAVCTEDGELAIVEVGDVARVADDRRYVGGDEVLSLAEAEQQRRVLARGKAAGPGKSAQMIPRAYEPSTAWSMRTIASKMSPQSV